MVSLIPKKKILMACTPMAGHVAPVLGVARGLVERGHEVLFHTGKVFQERVQNIGAMFAPLDPEVDYDYRHIDRDFPERASLPSGPAQLLFALKTFHIDVIPKQHEVLQNLLGTFDADVLLIDPLFCGAVPMMLGIGAKRVPVISLGITPMVRSSVDSGMFGLGVMPSTSPRARQRNAALHESWQSGVFGPLQEHLNEVLGQVGCPQVSTFLFDAATSLPNFYLQLCAPSFEYPRSDLPPTVRFVGPVIAPPATHGPELPWWSDLDGSRPVVVVTQGTVSNANFGELILPAMQALAQENVLVVVGTGGPPIETIPGPWPSNVRVGAFLPFHKLLPKAAVFVTNGGYGGMTHALSEGLPVLVAGDSEEKPEGAAHIAWTGAGINLATGRPSPEMIRLAVRALLDEPSYRENAQRLQADFLAQKPFDELERAIAELI